MINKLEPGDRQLSASSWNEMRDKVNNITTNQNTVLTGNKNPFLVTVKNTTNGALTPLSIVRIASATYSRTGDDFTNKGLEFGTELNGTAPVSEDDNVAIIQGACPSGGFVKGIASGCSPCKVLVELSNKTYNYAKPVSGQTSYLKATDDTTNIRILWHKTGSANSQQSAYVCLDASKGGDNRDYFVINKGNSQDTDTQKNDPAVYTAGSLHYITWDGNDWVPHSSNEATPSQDPQPRPSGSKLVVCQETAPTGSNKECKLHYFTPESNYGIPADYNSCVYTLDAGDRCGVQPGEHSFSDKCYDYRKMGGSFVYEPTFVATVQAQGQTGGSNQLYIDINNNQYECVVPLYNPTMADNSGPSYPDIWPYDYIVVSFDCESYTAIGLDYPRDYPEGTIMPWYRASSWSNPVYPSRGWQQYVPPTAGQGEITAVQIDKNGAHYDAAGDCVWVEAGANDKIPVKEGSLCFIEKVKTNAIV